MNPTFWPASEGSWFLVCAVVMVTAVNAISRQAATQPPAGTLGSVALVICRRHCKTVENKGEPSVLPLPDCSNRAEGVD